MLAKGLALSAAGVGYLGGISLLSRGRYAPGFFYNFQLDRISDVESTSARFLPFFDFTVASLIAYPATRTFGLCFSASYLLIGVGMRLKMGKDAAVDTVLLMVSAVAAWGSYKGWS
jgi:hypothetical protein